MIDKLEMFIALAREQHFGRAAEACGVTQPTLSNAIKQLEDQLGVQLAWRGSRFGGLTPEGARVLEWARQIVGDTRTMREEMRAVKHGLSGILRLAVIPTALTVVTELTQDLSQRHPGVRFVVWSRTSSEILNLLENLQIDAGLTYLDNEPLGRVTTVPLYAERYYLITQDSLVSGVDQISWAEAGALPLCLLTPDMQNRRIIANHLAEAGAEVVPTLETNSIITLISHVRTGQSATILPLKIAQAFLGTPGLQAIPISSPQAAHVVGLIAPHRAPHTPVLAALLQTAHRYAGGGPNR